MNKRTLSGTVRWDRTKRLPILTCTGSAEFGNLISLMSEFTSNVVFDMVKKALSEFHSGDDYSTAGCNYSIAYLDRKHELTGLENVAEILFNWSEDLFFILDITEFESLATKLHAENRSEDEFSLNCSIYDVPRSCRRPGTLFETDDEDDYDEN